MIHIEMLKMLRLIFYCLKFANSDYIRGFDMKVFFAYMFIVAGGILLMYGVTMKTTNGYSETLNIGLLFNQFEFIVVGALLFVSGYIVSSSCKLSKD
jgi:uncharacterized membrane protein